MSPSVPPSHTDLLTGPYYAILTTIAPDGQPENTIVWCSYDGVHVRVSTITRRRKAKNVADNPLVALTVLDPDDSGRWIDVRGKVIEVVPDTDNALINAHAKVYAGQDNFYGGVVPQSQEGMEQRIVIKIEPSRIVVSS